MLRRAWKPIAASIVVAGPAYYFYTIRDQTFQHPLRVKSTDGKKQIVMKTLPLLPMKSIDSRLGESGITETNSRPYGITWHHTTSALASNDPIEDAHSHQIIQGDDGQSDLLFFTVFDGHGGRNTSQLLSRTLINAVSLQLSKLAANTSASLSSTKSFTDSLWALWSKSSSGSISATWDVPSISSAIEDAFVGFDQVLLDAPISILKQAIQQGTMSAKSPVPDLSSNASGIQTMEAAISGSCALMALFDTAQKDLYIACTGDSRAVAGVWKSNNDGKGTWEVDVLSEDQTARNPKEVERLISEHPNDEADNVVMNGRVLGGLEPSRAFGDARYKWPLAMQELLNQVYMVGNGTSLRKPPKTFKTPPYVTARPVITHRKLSFKDPSSLRFLVLATDGLWDVLTPEEVVSLVGGHLAGLKGVIPKSELPSLIPTSIANAGVDGKAGKQLSRSTKQGSWAFVDDNISTHLIRNALGGGDEKELRQIMSIPAGMSRSYRDDITVTVVWWEVGKENNVDSVTIKSKL
ncbi:phosphatase 2C-like domain-containing protein [Lentinula aciculospora]|uniref:Phosphatase 2C-like domain-containing protein n=1 Tax=Lentinula aciculospora TaxID=153920 RepID=A0A9W9ABY8_9AGAR|nr:phosphatase 2C-like domain-containing protein [Lentinula aciculospora]